VPLKLNFKFKKKLTAKQRNKLADTVLEWGNLVFVGSILHQIINQGKIGWFGIIGTILWLISLAFGISLL